ncbi:hypothetical protein [Ramlibacter sp.]|nr:hypothetical protein [Ramlibacter sp.]MDB5955431.1 hypothetical protein [Ramlibacter sp.]
MKIKSNVRAGSGGNSSAASSNAKVGGHSSSQVAGTVGFYFPAISRCVGI